MTTKIPPIIAIIGSDGSGKSTVNEHLIGFLRHYGPASSVHLGKQAGNVERALIKLPFMGRLLGKSINKNRIKVTTSQPGGLSAAVIMLFVVRRLLRFRRMLNLRKQGNIILADRFPQMQIHGAYDGLLLPVENTKNCIVNWMSKQERKSFLWMTSNKPDLVIKLNVSLDVACRRKPDHRRDSLEKKVNVTPMLLFTGSNVISINADNSLAEVLSDVERVVAAFMNSKGFKPLDGMRFN